MAEMLLLGDAVASAFSHAKADIRGAAVPLVEAEEHSGAGLSYAVERFRRRCHGLGMSEVMIEQRLAGARLEYAEAIRACESPIEKVLLPWLVFEDYGDFEGPAHVQVEDGVLPLLNTQIVIVPQFKFLNYRLDFAVVVKMRTGDRRIIAVECDGEAHHRGRIGWDRHRDKRLASWGIYTVRAEGREAHSYPQAVSARVASIVIGWHQA